MLSTAHTALSAHTAPTGLIAVTGATGQLGRLVIAQLKARAPADGLLGLVRSPAKAADLGIATRVADYNRPDSLPAALAGVHTLLLISGNEIGQRLPQHRAVVEAAVAAGVKRIVYTSLLHADRSPLSLAPEHAQTEALIRSSGLAYTLLRNGWYFENHTAALGGALAAGALIGSAGTGRIAAATRADYAAAAAQVLTTTGHDSKTYELAGDKAFTLAELAAELSRQTGRNIPYQDLPVPAYAAALQSVGLPEGFAQALAAWDADAAQGALFDDGHQLSALIGRPTTPLADAVAAALAAASPKTA